MRQALGVRRGVLDLAVADRRLAVNPAARVKQPRLPLVEQRFLTADELTSLAQKTTSERDRLLVLVLGWTGLRFGEVIALRRSDVDVLRRRIRVERSAVEVGAEIVVGAPKTHQARPVALPRFLAADLAAYMTTSVALLVAGERVGYL